MRALKALVIGMGVLIVIGLTVVVVKMVTILADGPTRTADGGPGFGRLALEAPAACRIADAVAGSGTLVVRLDGPAEAGCGALYVVDPEAGRVLGRITAQADSSAADGAATAGAPGEAQP